MSANGQSRVLAVGAWSPGLTDALRRLAKAERRAPTEADAPPVSTFPSTPASREALRLDRGGVTTISKARRRELTYGKDAA